MITHQTDVLGDFISLFSSLRLPARLPPQHYVSFPSPNNQQKKKEKEKKKKKRKEKPNIIQTREKSSRFEDLEHVHAIAVQKGQCR
jgi:hypothetical protein